MNTVFLLQHLNIHANGEENVKCIGIYRSRESAVAAIQRLQSQPGFRDHPRIIAPEDDEERGFYIDAYRFDEDHWKKGFVTVVPSEV